MLQKDSREQNQELKFKKEKKREREKQAIAKGNSIQKSNKMIN